MIGNYTLYTGLTWDGDSVAVNSNDGDYDRLILNNLTPGLYYFAKLANGSDLYVFQVEYSSIGSASDRYYVNQSTGSLSQSGSVTPSGSTPDGYYEMIKSGDFTLEASS